MNSFNLPNESKESHYTDKKPWGMERLNNLQDYKDYKAIHEGSRIETQAI